MGSRVESERSFDHQVCGVIGVMTQATAVSTTACSFGLEFSGRVNGKSEPIIRFRAQHSSDTLVNATFAELVG